MKKIIKYRDLKIKNSIYKRNLLKAFREVLNSGQFIMGNKSENLEKKISKFVKSKYCIGVSSGTDALYLALKAIDIKKGDQVICPALSWIATANAISMTGAVPIFVDVNIYDQNINTDLIEKKITKKTKAIVPVHFLGRISEMNNIRKIAKKYRLKIVEDASQAFGAMLNNKYAGNLGDIAAISLNPMKVFCGFGESGIVLTNSKYICEKIKDLRYLGTSKEICNNLSLNFKIDEIQSALLSESLKVLDSKIYYQRKLHNLYYSLLSNYHLCSPFSDDSSTAYDFQILVKNRDNLKKYLSKEGIETKIKHPYTQPNQPIYRNQNDQSSYPIANYIVNHSLSLPLHPNMTTNDIKYVSNKINLYYSNV